MPIITNLHSPSAVPARPEMGRKPNSSHAGSEGSADPGRSIVPVHSDARAAEKPMRYARPAAVFLAQLIATAQQAPQTRQRRRAASDDAVVRYASATVPSAAGAKHRSSI
jgi:hypothetical protein